MARKRSDSWKRVFPARLFQARAVSHYLDCAVVLLVELNTCLATLRMRGLIPELLGELELAAVGRANYTLDDMRVALEPCEFFLSTMSRYGLSQQRMRVLFGGINARTQSREARKEIPHDNSLFYLRYLHRIHMRRPMQIRPE